MCQMDVKTAILNGILDDIIYMEIPEGINVSPEIRQKKICKLKRAVWTQCKFKEME